MAKRFEDLDKAIISHIREGRRAHPIYSSALLHLAAQCIGNDMSTGDEKEWRMIDRRMQVLRKKGVLQYLKSPARWIAVTSSDERLDSE